MGCHYHTTFPLTLTDTLLLPGTLPSRRLVYNNRGWAESFLTNGGFRDLLKKKKKCVIKSKTVGGYV